MKPRILVTAGAMSEPIDSVRVMTNCSTGRLGARIAHEFIKNEYEVFYVCGKHAAHPLDIPGSFGLNDELLDWCTVTTTSELYDVLEKSAHAYDVLIHAAAVPDFTFTPLEKKLKSSDPQEFIDSLRERIIKTPKILTEMRGWNTSALLVGFKFESGVTHDELIAEGQRQIAEQGSNVVICNDKMEMIRNQKHTAYALTADNIVHLEDKKDIAEFLVAYVKYWGKDH